MATLKGKNAGGDSKKVLKDRIVELQKEVQKKDQKIVSLLMRVNYVEAINNNTQKGADVIQSKYWFRAILFRLFGMLKLKEDESLLPTVDPKMKVVKK